MTSTPYTLHNPITGDGLPGSNPDLRFGNLYIVSIGPRYDGSPTMGSDYDLFSREGNGINQPGYGKIGATPINHPLTRINGSINLADLLGTEKIGKKDAQSSQSYALPVIALMLLYNSSNANQQ